MHVVRTESDLLALDDEELRGLIDKRIAEIREYVDHFGELATFVVVQPGDDIAAVDEVLGFQVMVNRFTGAQFGRAGFTPSWDVLDEHPGWFELVYVLSDDGQGVTMFISKSLGTSAELLDMCRRYSTGALDPGGTTDLISHSDQIKPPTEAVSFCPSPSPENLPMTDSIVSEFLDLLNTDHREAWEERSAILEFEAGTSRELAEALAMLLIIKEFPQAVLSKLS